MSFWEWLTVFGVTFAVAAVFLAAYMIWSWRAEGRFLREMRADDRRRRREGVMALLQAMREQMTRQHEDAMILLQAIREQMTRQHEDVVALMNRHHEDAVTLLQAIREQMARQHEDAMALLRAIRETVEAVRADVREADRRHTELMERMADLITAEGERTRRALGGGVV